VTDESHKLNCSFDELNSVVYEESIVTRLIKRYNIPADSEKAIRDLNEQMTDSRQLSLEVFHGLFPTFPMRLAVFRSKKLVKTCSVTSLFKHFHKLDPYIVFDELFHDQPELWERYHVGLVIDWPYLKMGGGLVIHNQPINTDIPGMRMLWVSPQGRQLVIEPLNTVLNTIDKNCPGGNGWQPEYDEYYGFDPRVHLVVDAKLIPVGGKHVDSDCATEVVRDSKECCDTD
jgi:hypothetical protein